ncbi:nuclear movement protein nudC [Plectosphaerella plurivora]|uniref:Nuclear movement protein nudC n=1 Tax=Plectosphaerella plurivora TaxID=936078 RepID=A0A9P9A6C9_9PEZI|nr:nuclear movement protein nudC [Plectosphaerella plurivora]
MKFRQPKNEEETAARAKQDAEQSSLPYVWKQTDIKWVSVEFTVPANLKSRDLAISFTKSSLKAGIRGQAPIIEGDFPHPIRVDDSTWTMVQDGDTKTVDIQLKKTNEMEWWPHIVTSAPKIDVAMIEPEETSLNDLEQGETRSMVEKMMYENMQSPEQKQKSKEAENMKRLEELAKQTGLDFSKAEINHG